MQVTPIHASLISNPEKSSGMRKVLQAAQEFEAILLESFINPLEKTFSQLPEDETELGMNGYQDLGTQALVSGIAKAGGLGIADMIVRNLFSKNLTGQAMAMSPKL